MSRIILFGLLLHGSCNTVRVSEVFTETVSDAISNSISQVINKSLLKGVCFDSLEISQCVNYQELTEMANGFLFMEQITDSILKNWADEQPKVPDINVDTIDDLILRTQDCHNHPMVVLCIELLLFNCQNGTGAIYFDFRIRDDFGGREGICTYIFDVSSGNVLSLKQYTIKEY